MTNMTYNTKTTPGRWNAEHDEILKERFHTDYIQDIADEIGFSRSTVHEHARKLGLRKADPRQRNKDIRAFVEMEFDNLTYKEMSKRTGLNEYTIFKIARELGLTRTREKWNENIGKGCRETFQRERRRAIFGLNQETRWKIGCNRKKVRLRHKLREHGYIVAKGDNTVYYTDDLERHPIRERNGEKLGLRFMPLPAAECPEETGDDQHLRPCGAVD